MHDVIVVGAGAGGPIVAKELAARGLDVLMLEAGPAWEDVDREWSHDENTANNPATGIFRFGPGDRAQAPWARDLPQNCFVWQTAGVGGSTVHYFANSPRAMPAAFDGELTYRELIPYYEWVEQTLPVQTAAMGTKEEQFLRAATKAGLPTQTSKDISGAACRPQENAILQPQGTAGRTNNAKQLVYPRARGCTFCGHCPQGCFLPLKAPRNLKAKRSTHASYVPMALTADRWGRGKAATLVADAFAPTSAARADFPGYGSIEQVGLPPGLQAQGLTDSEEPGRRLLGERLRRFLSNVDRLMSIAVITDDDVVPENRVLLSAVMTPDAHGPVARIELRRRTPRTIANREFLVTQAIEILRAAGARETVRMNSAPILLHIHSTMRMGAVVSSDSESLAVERLFVADNSALPNAVGGPNPTLTTQALATRTAEKIFVRYFGGDPWVGRESPVSSVDDTVTQAVLAAGL